MIISETITNYINDHSNEAYELLLELAQIPAPSNHEEQRAAFCLDWLKKQGAETAYVDEALNVVYPIGCTEDNPIVVYMGHIDVVFPDMTPLPLTVEDGLIKCPGVGDDTANVVALMMTAKYIAEQKIVPNTGILIVLNSGEEGLGNLKGCRKIFETYEGRITELITLDGGPTAVINDAVGSKRYKVEIDTEGGHSYGSFGNRNAIAYLASLIDTLYTIKVPPIGKTTYNVGLIEGGTSINTIAQHAEMLYEFRSDKREGLEIMEKHFNAAIEFYRTKGINVTVTLLGNRPCTGDVDPAKLQALTERAAAAMKKYYGYEVALAGAGSTDCNIPLSLGIPAVCAGCVEGSGAHTRGEYVKISSLKPGLFVAFELILSHF